MLKLPQVLFGKSLLPIVLAVVSFFFTPVGTHAQDPGPPERMDPAQMRERELKRIREQLEIADDAEWKLVSERVTKVLDLNRALRSFNARPRMGGPGGMNPPPPREGDRDAAGGPPGPPPVAPGSGPELSPEAEALQAAVKSKASNAELQQKLAKLQEARKKAQAELTAAQARLQELLSVRQEAIALTLGLL